MIAYVLVLVWGDVFDRMRCLRKSKKICACVMHRGSVLFLFFFLLCGRSIKSCIHIFGFLRLAPSFHPFLCPSLLLNSTTLPLGLFTPRHQAMHAGAHVGWPPNNQPQPTDRAGERGSEYGEISRAQAAIPTSPWTTAAAAAAAAAHPSSSPQSPPRLARLLRPFILPSHQADGWMIR